jgi:hypothetical protein
MAAEPGLGFFEVSGVTRQISSLMPRPDFKQKIPKKTEKS